MSFMSWIVSRLNDASDFFYSIYIEVFGWIFPFSLAANLFYQLSLTFNRLAWDFYDFSRWVDDVADKVADILSEVDIWNILSTPIEWAQEARQWVLNAWDNIWYEIDAWWATTWQSVEAWIDEAKQYAFSLIDSVANMLLTLKQSWDNFASSILPNLADWLGVESLINSTLATWFPFYNDLVSLWSEIGAFFTDPLQWLYNRLEEFFERFW